MTVFSVLTIASIRVALFVGCRLTVLPLLLGEAQHASLDESALDGVELNDLPLPASASSNGRTTASQSIAKLKSQSPADLTSRLVASLKDPHQATGHVFSLCFEESTILFVLVLLEATETISTQALDRNWTFSLISIIALTVFFIPMGVCLLMTFRVDAASSPLRRILYSVPGFILWSVLFLKVPLPSALSAQTTLLDAALARTALIGVVLIAILSGSGATSAAWDTYEAFFAKSRPKNISKSDVRGAEDSFRRTCSDLAARKRSLEQITNAPIDPSQQPGMLGRLWGSSQRSKEIKSLQQEIFGLQTLASAMRDDLDGLRSRYRQAQWSTTLQGRVLLGAGHLFSIYCIWRVILAALSLIIIGYRDTAPPDVVSLMLAHIVRLFNVDVNLDAWTRIFGLLFVGALILIRMRVVLANLSTFFRAASAGTSTSFLLLFLAEVLIIYLLATLIQLRASLPPAYSGGIGTEGAAQADHAPLLASLPSFNVVFGAVFDAAFLLASLATALLRWFLRDEPDRTNW